MIRERSIAWASIAVVCVVVIVGLWLSGSPAEVRARRLDAQRVSDLRRLGAALQRTWLENEQLPATLEELVDGRRLSELPVDPVTATAYEYRRMARGRFELCALFTRPSAQDTADENFWHHEAGRQCFEFDLSAVSAASP